MARETENGHKQKPVFFEENKCWNSSCYLLELSSASFNPTLFSLPFVSNTWLFCSSFILSALFQKERFLLLIWKGGLFNKFLHPVKQQHFIRALTGESQDIQKMKQVATCARSGMHRALERLAGSRRGAGRMRRIFSCLATPNWPVA